MAEATLPAPQPQQQQQRNAKAQNRQREQQLSILRRWNFLLQEGVAVGVDSSSKGSGGTLFVGGATVAQDIPQDMTNFSFRNFAQAYKKESEPKIIPQMTMTIEDYNRLVRMIKL